MATPKPVEKPIATKVVSESVEKAPELSERVKSLDVSHGARQVLRQDPDLAAVIREAADQVVRFIPDARLTLELLADPDQDADEQLFLGISTGMAEDDATEALEKFDQHWWVDNVQRARGLLCIDFRFE